MRNKKENKNIKSKIPVEQAQPGLKDNTISSLSIVFFIAISLHFIFVFLLPGTTEGYRFLNRNWGYNNISYYSTPIIILFYTAAILISYKKITPVILSLTAKNLFIAYIADIRKHKLLYFTEVSIFCTVLFFLLKINYAFLGDMDMRVDQAVNKNFVREDYGTMYLFYHFYHLLHSLWSIAPTKAFAAGSALVGGPFIFISLLTADLLGGTFFQKAAIALFSISIGATQFFFGYLEVYALPATFFALYIYTCIRCLKGNLHFIFPCLVLITLIWMHFLGIGLAPSLFVLAYKKFLYKWPLLNRITAKSFIILIICCLPLPFLIGRMLGLTGIMLPLTHSDIVNPTHLTLFSPVHFWELLNSQLLASGTGFFILLFITYKALRGQIKFDSILWFLASASFFTLYIAFVADNGRGSGDWDILAFPAIVFSVMVIYCLIYNYSNSHNSTLKYAIPVLIVFNLLNLFTWVGINATDRSIKKIADMIEYDPGTYYLHQMPADMILGIIYAKIGDLKDSHTFYNKLFAKNVDDTRVYYNYGIDLMKGGDSAGGINIMKQCVEKFPEYSLPYGTLLQYYEGHDMKDSAISLMQKMFIVYKEHPDDFDKRIGKPFVLYYFVFLYKEELQLKDTVLAKKVRTCVDSIRVHL
jgi:hypothetical protein